LEEIFVPASGMAMEEALLSEWLKQPGDHVGAGEAVAVVETDKASVELSPVSAGVLGRHLFAAGTTVKAGATVAYLLAEGEVEPEAQGSAPGSEPTRTGVADGEQGSKPAAENGAAGSSAPARKSLSPRQRRAAALASASAAPPPFSGFSSPEPAPSRPEQSPATSAPGAPRVPTATDGFRRAIAAQVAESWRTIPHFSVGRDVDATSLTAALSVARRYNRSVTITDFLLSALGQALVRTGRRSDVGLAVATDWGVLIPVVRDAGGTPFEELAARRKAAVDRARSRRLGPDDSLTPFATLSNLGTMGVDWFTGVVPVGQKALLTVGRVADRAVVEGRGIAIRAQFSATLTADHRELDGADSARLLGYFVDAVESSGGEVGT
jgi:pyruvate dehydrogenase E2 component (dihydrolipoamide acetyltransferase)